MSSNKQKGYVLLITIIVIGILFFFAFFIIRLYAADKVFAQKGVEMLIAEQAALAGIDQCLYEINKDASWNKGFNREILTRSNAVYSINFDRNQTKVPYSTNNNASTSAVSGYEGRIIPQGYVHIVSIGEFGNSRVAKQAFIETGGEFFKEALFGAERIDLGGTINIDSYDSSKGSYEETKRNTGGDIGTNASAPGSVRLRNVNIYGTLRVGPGGSESTTLSISGQPYYEKFEVMQKPYPLPDMPIPPLEDNKGIVSVRSNEYRRISPGTYSSFDIRGGTVELTPGEYIITQDMNLQSGGSILVNNGQVIIYVLGNISAASGSNFANMTNRSSNLVIYGGQKPQTFNLQGLSGSFLSFSLYAPRASLSFGGGSEFFGSFVARELLVNGNANFHYDAALPGDSGATPKIKIRW